MSKTKLITLFGAPGLSLVVFIALGYSELSTAARLTAAISTTMAIWWSSDTLPMAVTAMIPLVLFPVLQIRDLKPTAFLYSHPLILLFLGGFMLSISLQHWQLHRRIAYGIIGTFGAKPRQLIAGFMVSAAFMSMWVTNTATTMLMLPIALSVSQTVRVERGQDFSKALILGLAYAATLGGISTLVGTVPNAIFAAFVKDNLSMDMGFAQWFTIGFPVAALMLPATWWLLCYKVFPNAADASPSFDGKLPTMTTAEKRLSIILVLTAAAWLTRPLLSNFVPNLSDTGIAIAAAISLFIVPSGNSDHPLLMEWSWTKELPWNLLLLFGGGLALAGAIQETGLATWLGKSLALLDFLPDVAIVGLIVLLVIFLTEMTSNTATVATFLPIIATVANELGLDQLTCLVALTCAASCAFMLPVATPPNAIVYGSDLLRVKDMMRAGFRLNFIGAAIITLLASILVPLIQA